MALSVLTTRVLTLREVLRVRVCVGLRRRLRVVVVHAPCVPTTTTYSLRIYRCPYYVFTDVRTTTTTYLPMHVLHTYRFYLLLLCTDVPTTTHRAGRVPEAEPVGQQLEERAAARLPRLRVGSQGLGVRGWRLGIRD